jgi:acetoin utilization deacetylase AcuC-like enzyme
MKKNIAVYYRDDMVPPDAPGNYSKSPTKPRRFMEFMRNTPMWPYIEVRDAFGPVRREQLLTAHKSAYVDAFLTGSPRGLAESNGLTWSPQFRDSVLMTNSCLLTAITAAADDPTQVTMAPVSGFHHATPDAGQGFCTFSGQVVAALELYRSRGLRGAWIDLDGHYGNSIEDTRAFSPDLNKAIAPGLNINPCGDHDAYLEDLDTQLQFLVEMAARGEVDYVCVAHGADSHEWDQLGSQCTTAEWLRASDKVYSCLARLNRWEWAPKKVGVTLALFGGYRDDHPESVLGLHAMDVQRCLNNLCEAHIEYAAEVRHTARRFR